MECYVARAGTIFAGRGDEIGYGAVDVGVEDGGAGVGSPELAEHAVERPVVQLGELVEQGDAAGHPVVVVLVVAGEQGEQLRLAAEREHPRHYHRPCSGGDHSLHAYVEQDK